MIPKPKVGDILVDEDSGYSIEIVRIISLLGYGKRVNDEATEPWYMEFMGCIVGGEREPVYYYWKSDIDHNTRLVPKNNGGVRVKIILTADQLKYLLYTSRFYLANMEDDINDGGFVSPLSPTDIDALHDYIAHNVSIVDVS